MSEKISNLKSFGQFILLTSIVLTISGCAARKHTCLAPIESSTFQVNCKNNSIPSSYFTGKVSDSKSHEGIMDAKVILFSKDRTPIGTLTDLEGNFSIKDIPEGFYNIEVRSIEYAIFRFDLQIKQSSTCVAEINLYNKPIQVEKPVIYLYPTQKQNVQVKLNYAGTLTHTYPTYPKNGWQVLAEPNGTLYDSNEQEYYALFWEGKPNKPIIPQDGFVVSGKETAAFLEEKLAYLGLTRREANEFMMYWLPRMEDNPYNFIHFASKLFEEQAELDIRPKPETIIRVMMITEPLASKIKMPLQDLSNLKKTRNGFTVVEWGGSVITSIGNETSSK
ncbi:MAG: hypothetical protein CFE21_05970 [Bacteroidetes bacterium B1(2017)]|nr:MAG: hypothetical protein CFE21_05970 [Bacteroidetes bacterium B1(2017)]